jgi:hypothetical protein
MRFGVSAASCAAFCYLYCLCYYYCAKSPVEIVPWQPRTTASESEKREKGVYYAVDTATQVRVIIQHLSARERRTGSYRHECKKESMYTYLIGTRGRGTLVAVLTAAGAAFAALLGWQVLLFELRIQLCDCMHAAVLVSMSGAQLAHAGRNQCI